ncbi:hypothetical protein IZY60_14270 [Lutibacter sp. B2]|nr:hypothetical protein [Lutibacter sp. B2]
MAFNRNTKKEYIQIRVSKEEKVQINRMAQDRQMSVSNMIMELIKNESKVGKLFEKEKDTIDSLDQTLHEVSCKTNNNEMSIVVFEEKIDRLERTVDKLQAFEIENLEQEVDNIKYEIDWLKTNLVSAMEKLNSRIEKLEA